MDESETPNTAPGSAAKSAIRGSWSRFYPLIILCLGLAIYSNTIQVPFVFDDEYYIELNPAVHDFRCFLEPSLVEQWIAQGRLDQNFRTRRVAVLSLAVNYWLHGFNVQGYHLFNLCLHLSNSLLLYWLVLLTLRTPLFMRMLTPERGKRSGPPAALLVALFFVAHPVQTEAVTYICQRFTSMATLFYLLALDLFIAWRLDPVRPPLAEGAGRVGGRTYRPALYGLAVASTLLAMFSKEIAFTLPLMIVVYDVMFFGKFAAKRLWSVLPFLATMAIIPAITLGEGANFEDMARLSTAFTKNGADNEALTYLFTQFRVIITYLRLLLVPINQNLDYDFARSAGFFQAPVLASFAFLTLLSAVGIYFYWRSVRLPDGQGGWHRLLAFGICWFFLTLSVESTIIPLKDVLFEHRLYLPSVGFLLAGLAGLSILRARQTRGRSTGMICLLLSILAVMALATYARNDLWRDPIALWEDSARKSPDKFRPHYNLGKEYVKNDLFVEAEQEFLRAVEIDDQKAKAQMSLGALYVRVGQPARAIAYLERAASLDQYNPDIYHNFGIAYYGTGDYRAAARAFQQVLALNPSDQDARQRLATILQLLDSGE